MPVRGCFARKSPVVVATLLLTIAVVAPSVDALTQRDFTGVAVSTDFGDGAGIYDPSNPSDTCAAVVGMETHVSSAVAEEYYATARMTTNAKADENLNIGATVPLTGTPLQDCLGAFAPDQHLAFDSFHGVLGMTVHVDGLIDPFQVPDDLTDIHLTYEYCMIDSPTNPPVLGGGSHVDTTNCNDGTSHDLGQTSTWNYNAGSIPPSVSREQTIWTSEPTQGFASEIDDALSNQPGKSFTASGCLSLNLTNIVTGTRTTASDASHFVVLDPTGGDLLQSIPWSLDTTHWDNLTPDAGC